MRNSSSHIPSKGATHHSTRAHTVVRQSPISQEQLEEQARTLLGRYRVLETRGTGGFGTVEVCWDTRLQRRVAIKCMPLGNLDDDLAASTVDEALSEARYASRLSHPIIVGVHDFEWDGEYAYLVMEYVDGLTLAELLARVEGGVLTPDECSYLLSNLASALEYAHKNRVLHLDIKPANIIIDRSGVPKIGDFGMATLASATGYGDARGGTVGYMPPEQIQGELVDERCDLFALAVCLVQALTGKRPFAAPTAEQSLRLISRGATEALAQIRLECGHEAADALQAALEPTPAYRTPSVEQFAAEAVPALGNSDHGLASLQDLLDQLDDEDEGTGAVYHGVRLPLAERAPWLPSLIVRTASACLCGWAGWLAASTLVLPGVVPTILAIGICALCGALLPSLGSGLALACIAVSFAMGATGPAQATLTPIGAFALIGLVIALGAWWIFVARTKNESICALLFPCVLGQPIASVALSAAALNPLQAGATAALSWFLSQALSANLINTETLASALMSIITTPSNLLEGITLVLAAAIGSIFASRGKTSLAITGQIAAFLIALGGQLLVGRVENGGIWVAPEAVPVAVAVLLCVFMCVTTVSFGPSNARQET